MSNDAAYIGVCIECHSDQPAAYMQKTKFEEPSCRYCGGVVNVIRYRGPESREQFLKNMDESRGINSGDQDSEEDE